MAIPLGREQSAVDPPLRRAMLHASGFAAIFSIEQGIARSTLFPVFRLLFFAELLEARIIPQRIEYWIEPEQRRSKQPVQRQCTLARGSRVAEDAIEPALA